MSEKKTKDEEAIIALAHALADAQWLANDRLDDTKRMQEDIDNLNAINNELNDRIFVQKDEIARLNEDCARRAKDLVTFDQMRAQAIRERDEARDAVTKFQTRNASLLQELEVVYRERDEARGKLEAQERTISEREISKMQEDIKRITNSVNS